MTRCPCPCLRLALLLFVLSLCVPGPRAAVLYVRQNATGPFYGGSSWATAITNVNAAAALASPGDEIWVAAGHYGPVDLKSGVALYGGFNGTETARSQRDWRKNVTSLSGAYLRSIVTIHEDAGPDTIVDGFLIQNGTGTPDPQVYGVFYGGGVYCSGGSPVLRHNDFFANSNEFNGDAFSYYQKGYGGAVYCANGAAPRIEDNVFRANYSNYGGAVYCEYSSPTIINNTFLANSGYYLDTQNSPSYNGAIHVVGASSTPLVANNILAYGYGVSVDAADPGAPVLRNNCLFNGNLDYVNLPNATGQDGNIAANPMIASLDHGNPHLQPGSPCVDAGNDADTPQDTDMDGQPRVIGSHVDIGADESDGSPYTDAPRTLYVSRTGADDNDGLTWTTAKRTVNKALWTTNHGAGDEVWVAGGVYNEYTYASIYNVSGVYGGFTGTETAREQRNPARHPTTLLASINVSTATLDGFTIRPPSSGSGFIGVSAYGNPSVVSNNVIMGWNNAYGNGGGLQAVSYDPVMYPVSLVARGNTLRGNTARNGGGIYLMNVPATLANNALIGNTAGGLGGGVYTSGGAVSLLNNTIVGNGAGSGGAIDMAGAGTRALTNNIIAFNASGLSLDAAATGGATLSHNDVFSNGLDAFTGLPDPAGTNGNIAADPLFSDGYSGGVHLRPSSPCVDAGENSAAAAGDTDFEGQPRIQGLRVDIGADENDGGTIPPLPTPVIRVRPDGSDANDGSSWAAAKKTIQAALNAGLTAEVWAAAGTYREALTLLPYHSLYGGFAGTETDRAQRRPAENTTTLTQASSQPCIRSRGFGAATVDGFTIRDGAQQSVSDAAGGVVCDASSPTLANNTFTNNPGDVSCLNGAAPTITGNTFLFTYKGGIVSFASSPAVTRNTFTKTPQTNSNPPFVQAQKGGLATVSNNVFTNIASPIFSDAQTTLNAKNNVITGGSNVLISIGGPGTVANNTIALNTGTAIGVASRLAVVENNIVALNGAGFAVDAAVGANAVIRNNCIFGNTTGNAPATASPIGNIASNPRFANTKAGDFHISADSPCVDAGDDGVVSTGDTDTDGQARIQGAHVDIGADESDGTVYPGFAIRVKPDGNDADDGSSWDKAKKTLASAATAISLVKGGGEIWVAAGTYTGGVQIGVNMAFLGGFAGTETLASQRDFRRNTSILDGGGNTQIVQVTASALNAVVDGFTIRNGAGGLRSAAPGMVIRNNTFTGNTGTSGAAIYLTANAVITNNVFRGNIIGGGFSSGTGNGAAIFLSANSSTISGNTFMNNGYASAAGSAIGSLGGAIFASCTGSTTTGIRISGNAFSGNNCGGGGAVYATLSTNTVPFILIDNVFTGNSALTYGGGLYISGGKATVANNSFAYNAARSSGGAVYNSGAATLFANNTVAFNESGLAVVPGSPSALPTLKSNDFYGNTAYDVSGVTDPAGTNGNIKADPQFGNPALGNLHIQPGSPLVDAGNASVVSQGDTDIDGQPRIQGAGVDIGADESDGQPVVPGPVPVARVRPDGNDANDGQTWATAKKTVQAALNSLGGGGEVWVAAGTYTESISVGTFRALYGGFAGTETKRQDRSPTRNLTVLAGVTTSGNPRTVVTVASPTPTVVDGFTIRYGSNALLLLSGPVRVSNNVLTGNNGGGVVYPNQYFGVIAVYGAAPVIINNRIAGNIGESIVVYTSASTRIADNVIVNNDTGVTAYAAASITNNTILGNVTGLSLANRGNPTTPARLVENNILAGNGTGLSLPNATAATVRANVFYGSTTTDYIRGGVTQSATQIAQSGNMQADPRLAGLATGNFHIQPNSPCRDAGDDTVVQPGDTDMDGQPRILGAHADIGADESDLRLWKPTPVIMRVSPAGDDTGDGSSWAKAKRTVQAALNALADGGEVWTAAGTYSERITVPAYTQLYGGFGGTETRREARNWSAHPTVLDGSQGGTVVTVSPSGVYAVVDGFTIQNGAAGYGGGVSLQSVSNEVAHCRILHNAATYNGGAIYSERGSINIHDCLIAFNSAAYGSAVSAENINGHLTGSTIANNTTLNAGGGSIVLPASVKAANNVVAFNVGGLQFVSSQFASARAMNNDVFGNADANDTYYVSPGINGNISVNPLFVDAANGDFRLRSASPAVDAGDDASTSLGGEDVDARPRVRGLHVDMGAYETDGPRVLGAFPVEYVSPAGDDLNDGSSWARAKRTPASALADVRSPGGEVWVAAGAYLGGVIVPGGDSLLGGFAGTETASEQRRPAVNVTTMNSASSVQNVIAVPDGANAVSVDGFTIRGGSIGVRCGQRASVTVKRCSIVNTDIGSYATAPPVGAGVYCDTGSNVDIQDTSLLQNGNAVVCLAGSHVSMERNIVAQNNSAGYTGLAEAGGLTAVSATVTLKDNAFISNTGPTGAINAFYSVLTLTGNTLAANRTLYSEGPASNYSMVITGGSLTAANNIVALNADGFNLAGSVAATFRNNDVYGNTRGNYIGVSDPTGGDGNLAVDPELLNLGANDFHLALDSPCRDAGADTAASAGETDLDGQPRVQGVHVDIGADEVQPDDGIYIRRIVRVKPDGDDTADGASWETARKTIGAAMAALPLSGGEVWAAAGTYGEAVTITSHTALLGGFAGGESSASQRDGKANTTYLHGPSSNTQITVVRVPFGSVDAALDGFTVQGADIGMRTEANTRATVRNLVFMNNTYGVSASGALDVQDSVFASNNYGVSAYDSGATAISRNVFSNQNALGVDLSNATARVDNNLFYGNRNAARMYGGDTVFVNNTVSASHDTTTDTAAILFSSARASVANNIIALNGIRGFAVEEGSVLEGGSNVLYGNTGGDYFQGTDVMGMLDFTVTDPLFVNPATSDYHLQAASPARDAGDDARVATGELDLDGKPRIQGAHVDIGAFEFPVLTAASGMTPAQALRMAGGLGSDGHAAMAADDTTDGVMDLAAAVRLARRAAGLGTAP